MAGIDNKDIFDLANPSPRTTEERDLHGRLASAWGELSRAALYGIRFYTAAEEARLRSADFTGDPSIMNPRWVGSGPVTAMVTVATTGIERGTSYQGLVGSLQAAAPEVEIVLSPWGMTPPEDHVLASAEE